MTEDEEDEEDEDAKDETENKATQTGWGGQMGIWICLS